MTVMVVDRVGEVCDGYIVMVSLTIVVVVPALQTVSARQRGALRMSDRMSRWAIFQCDEAVYILQDY